MLCVFRHALPLCITVFPVILMSCSLCSNHNKQVLLTVLCLPSLCSSPVRLPPLSVLNVSMCCYTPIHNTPPPEWVFMCWAISAFVMKCFRHTSHLNSQARVSEDVPLQHCLNADLQPHSGHWWGLIPLCKDVCVEAESLATLWTLTRTRYQSTHGEDPYH